MQMRRRLLLLLLLECLMMMVQLMMIMMMMRVQQFSCHTVPSHSAGDRRPATRASQQTCVHRVTVNQSRGLVLHALLRQRLLLTIRATAAREAGVQVGVHEGRIPSSNQTGGVRLVMVRPIASSSGSEE